MDLVRFGSRLIFVLIFIALRLSAVACFMILATFMFRPRVHATLARVTSILGPRSSALRTACRNLAMRVACARHGAQLSFSRECIDVSKGKRTIRISMRHFPYALDMARSFEHYFGQIVPIGAKGQFVVDYSRPKLHRYVASGLEFELSSFAEEASAIDSYFRWYRPRPGDVVFDLGAYCGVSSYYFSQMVGPSGTVYASNLIR